MYLSFSIYPQPTLLQNNFNPLPLLPFLHRHTHFCYKPVCHTNKYKNVPCDKPNIAHVTNKFVTCDKQNIKYIETSSSLLQNNFNTLPLLPFMHRRTHFCYEPVGHTNKYKNVPCDEPNIAHVMNKFVTCDKQNIKYNETIVLIFVVIKTLAKVTKISN